MGTPKIYLDTADYSRFADIADGRSDLIAQKTWDFLIPLVESGKIKIYFSHNHMSELLQYNEGGRELTLRKAKTISRLCKGNAFKSLNDIILIELYNIAVRHGLARPNRREYQSVISDCGEWYPTTNSPLSTLPSLFDGELDTIMKEKNIPRHQRRKIAATFFRSAEWRVHADNMQLTLREKVKDYPGFDKILASGDFTKLLEGKIDPKILERKVMSEMTIPENFVIYYFERYEGDKDYIPTWMKTFSKKIYDEIPTLLEVYDKRPESMDSKMAFDILSKQIQKMPQKLSLRLMIHSAEELKRLGITGRKAEALKLLVEKDGLPTLMLFSELTGAYVGHLIKQTKYRPKLKESDGADILHALYIPHCDIWRGDVRSAPLFQKIANRFKTRAVGKLEELPDIISAAIN